MSELKLTNEKMKTYCSEDKKGAFKTSARLEAFGENQNGVNELLAANINDLIKRVCALEEQQLRNNEIMKKVANELASLRGEIDRLKLTAKLNTGAVKRLDDSIRLLRSGTPAGSDESENV